MKAQSLRTNFSLFRGCRVPGFQDRRHDETAELSTIPAVFKPEFAFLQYAGVLVNRLVQLVECGVLTPLRSS
ncbi:MAG: hypothetical protein C4576_05290 [Desulfobacteraceae bacterium]|nr:MAG: hypothetical protein C4576_05290 [Desulfobacteraceae bacterium]